MPSSTPLLIIFSFFLLYIVLYIRSNNNLAKSHTISSHISTPDLKASPESVKSDDDTHNMSNNVTVEPEQVKNEKIVILPEGALVPAGSHVRFNFATGQRELILDGQETTHRHLPALFVENNDAKPKEDTPEADNEQAPINSGKYSLGNKWKRRYDKTYVDEVLEQIGKEQSSSNSKTILSLLDALEEEAHNVNTGAGILHSEYLPQMTSLLSHSGSDGTIKRAVLGVLRAALHNNTVALRKAQEIELMPKILNVLQGEKSKWWSDNVIVRKTIFILHSMLANQPDSSGDEQKSFKTQFMKENGYQALAGAFDESDELTREKIIDILVAVGKEARTLINRLDAESKQRVCQKHALECK